MGFAASPHNSDTMALIAEEVCKGDRHQTEKGLDNKELNPLLWDYIHLNLPGTDGYIPTFSWVSKMRKDGQIACVLFTFVYMVGPPEELTWQAAHILAAKQSYLGIQAGCRAQGTTMQPNSRYIVGLNGLCDGEVGCVCVDVRGEMIQAKRDSSEVVGPVAVR